MSADRQSSSELELERCISIDYYDVMCRGLRENHQHLDHEFVSSRLAPEEIREACATLARNGCEPPYVINPEMGEDAFGFGFRAGTGTLYNADGSLFRNDAP